MAMAFCQSINWKGTMVAENSQVWQIKTLWLWPSAKVLIGKVRGWRKTAKCGKLKLRPRCTFMISWFFGLFRVNKKPCSFFLYERTNSNDQGYQVRIQYLSSTCGFFNFFYTENQRKAVNHIVKFLFKHTVQCRLKHGGSGFIVH